MTTAELLYVFVGTAAIAFGLAVVALGIAAELVDWWRR